VRLFTHRIPIKEISFERWLKRAFPDGYFRDTNNEVYWGRHARGILFVRNHPDEGWQLLVTLRSGNVEQPNTWGITVGAIADENDDSFESAKKETMEEIGSFPSKYRLINEYTWKAPNGTFTYTTYMVEVLDPTWEDYEFNWEVDDARWVSMENASQLNLHPGFAEMLGSMGSRIFGHR